MTLLEELQSKRLDAIQNHALKIAEDLEHLLIEAAEQGRNSYEVYINDRDDKEIIKSNEFIEGLTVMLEGCSVEVTLSENTNIFNRPYYKWQLKISW